MIKEIFVRTTDLHFCIRTYLVFSNGAAHIDFDIYSAGKSHFDSNKCFYTKGGLPVDSHEDADWVAFGLIREASTVLVIGKQPLKLIDYEVEFPPRFDDITFENLKEIINTDYLKKIYDEVSV